MRYLITNLTRTWFKCDGRYLQPGQSISVEEISEDHKRLQDVGSLKIQDIVTQEESEPPPTTDPVRIESDSTETQEEGE